MNMHRREFLQLLALASAGGLTLTHDDAKAAKWAQKFYDLPRFGNVHFLHFTDCHAQLLPMYFREPNVNLGLNKYFGQPPHLVGDHLLTKYGFAKNSPEAYAFTHLDFEQAAKQYGQVGGFAHLATLIKRLRQSRPGALLLDGGDTWQGSGTALWTKGQDMVDVCLALGVDIMTAHWEMTLGAKRVQKIINKDFKGKIDFVAQNIKTRDFEDPVFLAYSIKEMNGVKVAVIGQAFPYTPIANPRYFFPEWTFGIQEENMQSTVDEVRAQGCQAVIVLSHNGMDVDLKMATRVTGIDAIMGGHTHDAVPQPIKVQHKSGVTLVTNAGSNGKFLGVLDLLVKSGKVQDFSYKLMPIFSRYLPADESMHRLITKIRAPYVESLSQTLAVSEGMLYRRGNFNGSFDQLIVDGLMKMKDAEIAFSPGFRWGTTLLPGQTITMERLLDQTAITYPYTTLNFIKGNALKMILEDVADNLFNPDPYYQQGGDMVRVGGLEYSIDPLARIGQRINDIRLNGKPIDPNKSYKVASWAPVSKDAKNMALQPIWELLAQYLREIKTVPVLKLNQPTIVGIQKNPGLAEL